MARGLGEKAQELLQKSYRKNNVDGRNADDIVDGMLAQLCDPGKSYEQVTQELDLTGSDWERSNGRQGPGWTSIQTLRKNCKNNGGRRVLERYIREYPAITAPETPLPPIAPATPPSNNGVAVVDAPAAAAAAAAGDVAAVPPLTPFPHTPARGHEAYSTQAQTLEIIRASQASTNQLFDRVGERFGEVGEGLNRVGGQIGELTQVVRFQQDQIDDNRAGIDDNRRRIGNLEERRERDANANERRFNDLQRQIDDALTPNRAR